MTDQPTPAQLREAADILAAACDDRDVNWATPDDLREWAQRQEEEAARAAVFRRARCADVNAPSPTPTTTTRCKSSRASRLAGTQAMTVKCAHSAWPRR